jgi:hypothetical protein
LQRTVPPAQAAESLEPNTDVLAQRSGCFDCACCPAVGSPVGFHDDGRGVAGKSERSRYDALDQFGAELGCNSLLRLADAEYAATDPIASLEHANRTAGVKNGPRGGHAGRSGADYEDIADVTRHALAHARGVVDLAR